MGFGIMIFGAFLLTDALSTEVLGFALLFWGMSVASRHCTCFLTAKKAAVFGIVLSVVKLAWKITDVFNAELLPETAENIFSSVYTAYLVVFYYLFFKAIAKIAEETELPGIQRMAYANILLSAVFLIASRICYALVAFMPDLLGAYKAQVLATAMLLPIIVMLLCFVIVFRCYMRICLEGDEDMEEKRNSFKSPMEFYENDKYKNKNKKK
ncbi:MAG: hypothetical protein IJW21_02380 [Clostridia bacterium]|nr:hypothetical protein [Clostridia bacterium]